MWSSNGDEWAGSGDASALEYYEDNGGNLAVEVVGQNQDAIDCESNTSHRLTGRSHMWVRCWLFNGSELGHRRSSLERVRGDPDSGQDVLTDAPQQ